MLRNCHNSAFLELKKSKAYLCEALIQSKLDLTLWSRVTEKEVCLESLLLIDHLTPSSDECVNDADAEECNPCSKFYNYVMDKYAMFVL